MFEPAKLPTLYFLGVTTKQSSIMKVFPKWMKTLKIDAEIKGIDLPIHAQPDMYRKTLTFIKNDSLSLGALVTTHKIDMYYACEDMFDGFGPYAKMLGEISSISKRETKLWGHAKDPISSGLALEEFVPKNYWKQYGGEILLFGAGGSSLAMATYLTDEKRKDNVPRKITIANRSVPRLEAAKIKLSACMNKTEFAFCHAKTPKDNDRIMAELPERSLVVNATGLGKDAPGSPVSNRGQFPKNGMVWEINYRGELNFLHQAKAQQSLKNLYIEDGWIYFIHGWTQVIMEVFGVDINGEMVTRLSEDAKKFK